MRDIVVTVIIVGLMPVCFRRPFVGLCVFSWLAYMRVQDLAWGWARDMRWSFYVAILTFAGFFLLRERGKRMFLNDARSYIMIALVVLSGIGVALSVAPDDYQFKRYLEFVKIVAVSLFTTAVVRNREQLRILLWVIALSLAFYGVKSGIWGILTLGRSQILIGPGGMLADSNDLSLAMAMAVPMLYHLGWTERRPELRRAFWFAVPLTMITVGLTHSRGGFLSLATALAFLIWRSRNRLLGLLAGLLVAGAAFVLAPESYKERLATLADPVAEGSAASRLRAWGIATRMALDNPFLGVGFGKFQQHYVEYAIDPTEKELAGKNIVAHSSYLQIWAECGSLALLLYFVLIGASFWTCWTVRRMAERRYYSSWMQNYAALFEASLATFVVGSSFLNRAHFDLFYHWVALIMVFGVIAMREMKDDTRYPRRGPALRQPSAARRPPGFARKLVARGA